MKNDIPTSEIEFMLLADRAEAINGKLYIMGGGWERITLAELPVARTMGLAISVVIPLDMTRPDHRLELSIEGPDDPQIISSSTIGFARESPPQHKRGRAIFGIEITAGLRAPGAHRLIAILDDGARREAEFTVEVTSNT